MFCEYILVKALCDMHCVASYTRAPRLSFVCDTTQCVRQDMCIGIPPTVSFLK